MAEEDKLLTAKFMVMTQENKAKTAKEGRPIFDEMEIVEVRTAGDRTSIKVFPAHAFARWVSLPDGDSVSQTYAERWPEQYKRFKAGHQQIADGTPVDELPFLTAARKSELKALGIYTVEALDALDGQNLKVLGMQGRELKAQARAYIEKASGGADVVAMAAQIESLKETVAMLQADKPAKKKADAA